MKVKTLIVNALIAALYFCRDMASGAIWIYTHSIQDFGAF